MEREPHHAPVHLTGIQFNLEAQAIEFEDRHGTVGRLRFTGERVLYEGRPLILLPSGQRDSPAERPPPPVPSQPPTPDPSALLFRNPSPRSERVTL